MPHGAPGAAKLLDGWSAPRRRPLDLARRQGAREATRRRASARWRSLALRRHRRPPDFAGPPGAARHNERVRARRVPAGRERRRRGVGVDLGGTWVRVIATDARGRRRSLTAPSPGLRALPAFLRAAWHRWGLGRRDVDALVVASRGVWTSAERALLARRLRGLAVRVAATSDAEAAYLGALGERPGILLLAGTGSMALGRDARGRWARAGGLGPLLGDEGSAFWIGREWLRAAAREGNLGATRRMLRSPEPVARIAALSPRVLGWARAGNRRARAIAARGQDALAQLLVTA